MRTPITVSSLALLACASLAGCAQLEDCHYDFVNKWRAKQAYCACYPLENPCTTSTDYKHGWIDGYYTVMTGGGCQPPILPPRKYWSACAQNPDGLRAKNRWYVGWQDGAAVAQSRPNFHYVNLWQPQGHVAAYPAVMTTELAAPAAATGATPPPAPEPASAEPDLAPPEPAAPVPTPVPTDETFNFAPDPAPAAYPATPNKTAPAAIPVPTGEPTMLFPPVGPRPGQTATGAADKTTAETHWPPLPHTAAPATFVPATSATVPPAPAVPGRVELPEDRPGVGAFDLDFTGIVPVSAEASVVGRASVR